ncbi:hypothetical protein PFISCL1PPCAC_10852, partial [Pristionchus fissidentatus]
DYRLTNTPGPILTTGGDRVFPSIGGLIMGERGRGVTPQVPPIDFSTVIGVADAGNSQSTNSSILAVSKEIRMWRSFLLRELDWRSKIVSKIARNS